MPTADSIGSEVWRLPAGRAALRWSSPFGLPSLAQRQRRGCAVRFPRSACGVASAESESADRICRDGLKVGREASGARRGEPRCPETPHEFVPAMIARAFTLKLLTGLSPSWRPGVSPGCSHGERRQSRLRFREQRGGRVMHPTAVAAFCRHAGQRARGGVGARDGLEVERVFRLPVVENPTWQAPFRKSNSAPPAIFPSTSWY